MPKVSVQAGSDDEAVGEFEFDQMPRIGEDISVPCEADPSGMRSFVVENIYHVAAGVAGTTPSTVIHTEEMACVA